MDYSHLYTHCTLCPRLCGVDRSAGETGTCGQTAAMRIAVAVRHFGEEPPLVGGRDDTLTGGSGTIFFTGCTMRCGFCQNRQLSRGEVGREVSTEELAGIMLALQEDSAVNVNIVSGTPFVPGILAGIHAARRRGLTLPVVWNSSGYETVETVELLSSAVDIFLPDLKCLDEKLAGRLCAASRYPEYAAAAIEKMLSYGPVRYESDGTLRSGTIVRHLVLPGLPEQTRDVLQWCAQHGVGRSTTDAAHGGTRPAGFAPADVLPAGEFSSDTPPAGLLSLMVQFGVPEGLEGWRRGVREIENRPLSAAEYDYILNILDELGIDEGFVQEPGDEAPWWPDFTRANPFPAAAAVPVWPVQPDKR